MPGAVFHLKCKLNRKDVDEKVSKPYHGCESFFNVVLDGCVMLKLIILIILE